MVRSLSPIFAVLWRGALVLLTLQVAAVSLKYLTGSDERAEFILANGFADPFLVWHVLTGVTALLLGPLQFLRRARERVPRLHRAIGRTYAAACILGAPAGLMLAFGTTAGPVAGIGFAIPAVLWAAFTGLGLTAAMERRFAAHREWMLRSYALTSNAITLRLMLPLSALLGIDFAVAYPAIAWLSWSLNLALFEVWLRWSRLPARR